MILAGCFFLSLAALAQQTEKPKPAECVRVETAAFPGEDQPSPQAIESLAGCDSESLYYGIGRAAEPAKARECAFAEMASGSGGDVWGGANILMMIYANGKGADRNIDLAIKLACEKSWAPAEVQARIEHLHRLQEQGSNMKNFDLCDDITSGYMGGFCAGHAERIESVRRQDRLASMTGRWSREHRQAFHSLEQAASRFFMARRDNEVDTGGSARVAFMVEEEASLRNDFLVSLDAFETGKLPAFSARQFADADARLNTVYGKAQPAEEPSYAGAVTRKGIKNTQREWIRYRDAWVAFGKKKYPKVSAESWKTYFTEKRIRMLEAFH